MNDKHIEIIDRVVLKDMFEDEVKKYGLNYVLNYYELTDYEINLLKNIFK